MTNITDHSGNNISNNSHFVVFQSDDITELLTPIAKSKQYTIYDYNRNVIDPLLSQKNVNPNIFLSSGHVIRSRVGTNPNKIILVNKNISKQPTSSELIMYFIGGQIINPTIENNESYSTLGFYFIKNDQVLNNNFIALIPTNLLEKLPHKNNLAFGDYSIVGQVWTVNMKVSQEISTKKKPSRNDMSYNVQGELIANNNCLTLNDDSSVYFDTCDSTNKNQKWTVKNHKIKPLYNSEECLEANYLDNMYIKSCQDIETQSWNTLESDATPDNIWDKYRGKRLVLVQADNPWYINTQLDPSDDNKITDLTQRIQSNQYKIEVEPFDNGTNVNTNNEKYLTLMLCIIIIAIIMYKWMVVKH